MKRVPNALCRDDTEHGVYYYLATGVDAMMGQGGGDDPAPAGVPQERLTRKWLAECHAWLDDPGSVQFQNVEGTWFSSCRQGWNPIMNPDYNWRIKPATIMINGVELPKPVQPDCCTQFMITVGDGAVGHQNFWFNTREDRDKVYTKLVEVLGS